MRLFSIAVFTSVILSACATPTMTRVDKPTFYYLEREKQKDVTHVEVLLDVGPDKVVEKVKAVSGVCLEAESSSPWMTPVEGVGLVSGNITTRRSVEEVIRESNRWLALRTRGSFNIVPIAFEIEENGENGSKVVVYRANKRKKDKIIDLLTSGEIFCRFKEISYPFD